MFDGDDLHDGPALILVEDGRIHDVDRTGAAPPDGVELVDLGALTVLPGFIDAHTHLAWDPQGKHEQLATTDIATLLTRARSHAEQALQVGVTTLRDLGDRGFVTAMLRAEDGGPELLVAGPPITRTGGHCWFLGGQADTREQLVAAVTERADRRVDWVKVMATGGFSTDGSNPGRPQYTVEHLTALVEAAHSHGLPVTAHAHAATGIAAAVAAGVDGVEHCTFHTEHGAALDHRILQTMADKGIWAGVTVSRPRDDRPEWIQAIVTGIVPRAAELLRAGVGVVLSTDGGIVPTKRHDGLPADLVYAASRGLTARQVLTAATASAAAACHVGDRKGRILPGYDADLIAVAGNPLHRIETILDVQAIFLRGHRVR
jgi:imidazolonepropionase-like amidohydrolase